MMEKFSVSDAGIGLVRQFEGLRLNAYADQVGVWTIGYGHTGPEVHAGLTITHQEAEALLRSDVVEAEGCVRRLVTAKIGQEQFDALVDFVLNLGCTRLAASILLRLINEEAFVQAADQFARWDHAGGVAVPGLLKRRLAEAALFRATSQPAT